MKEINEGEAREALMACSAEKEDYDLLSTLITHYFKMEKALKEIARCDFDAYSCEKAQQALTGKGEGE